MAKATKNISLVSSDVYGIVKWFNKGHGRIAIKDYGDVFVHFAQIIKPAPKCYSPQKFLRKGQTVKCDLLSGPKGLQARKVIVVIDTPDDDKQSVTSDIPDVSEDYFDDSSSDSDEDKPPKHHNILERDLRGEVVSFFIARGFGFVKTHQYGSIFCHNTDIVFSGEATTEKRLTPTQFVKCDVARGPKGLMAVNVSVICEANPTVEVAPIHASRDSSASRQPRKNEGPTTASKQTKAEKQPKKNEVTTKAPESAKAVKQSKKKEAAKGGTQLQQPQHAKTQPKPKENPTASASKLCKGDPPVLHADVLGEVLHYNPLKGFGFIKVPIHGSVFVHKNGLINCEKLEGKQIVKFDIVKGPKTLMAINLKIISDAAPEGMKPAVEKSEPETKKQESKEKKKKKAKTQEGSNVIPLMSPPATAARSCEKPPLPAPTPPTAPPMNPYFHPPPPMYPYPHPTAGMPMHMPGPPPFAGFGPPPPYMAPPPHMAPPAPPRTVNPPPYPGQVAPLNRMLDKTHISPTNDPFVKPEDPKASCERRLHEGVAKELICGICEDLLEDPVITPCEHLFCRGCLHEWLPYQSQCPIDREPLSKAMVKDAPKVIKNLLCKT